MKHIDIYTDGACSGNPGLGGWSAILQYRQHEKEISGSVLQTTNNRMELTAIIQALKLVNEPCDITIYSDSAYVCNAFTKNWIENWQQNGWQTTSKKNVENIDLWKELLSIMQKHCVQFQKVLGHADNHMNNRCDTLARAAIKRLV